MDGNRMSRMVYGYFPRPCPKCGTQVSAYGRVYTYRVTDREKRGREEGEPRGSSYEETAGETLHATCPSCGHRWGSQVEAFSKIVSAREIAPDGARYVYDSGGYHWVALYGSRNVRAGDVVDHVPEITVEVDGVRFGVEAGYRRPAEEPNDPTVPAKQEDGVWDRVNSQVSNLPKLGEWEELECNSGSGVRFGMSLCFSEIDGEAGYIYYYLIGEVMNEKFRFGGVISGTGATSKRFFFRASADRSRIERFVEKNNGQASFSWQAWSEELSQLPEFMA